jgi:hypothetical protein
MQPNVGGIDRVLRIVLGAAIIGWGVYAGQNWLGQCFLYNHGVPLLLSGLVGQCFLYKLIGVSTCKVK